MATIKYFGHICTEIGKKEEDIDAKNISELLKIMKKEYGTEVYKVAKNSHIVINGENAGLKGGFRAKLLTEDTVYFLPVCGGG